MFLSIESGRDTTSKREQPTDEIIRAYFFFLNFYVLFTVAIRFKRDYQLHLL